jgi:hypothetical protein
VQLAALEAGKRQDDRAARLALLGSSVGGVRMAWSIEGTYFENCNCDAVCPCTWSGLSRPADNDRCKVLLAFHVDRGDVDGVDVSGLTFGIVADAPKQMTDGNWRVGLLLDAAATDDQAAKLQGVATGELGGPMANLAPLIGEVLGAERVAVTFETADGVARARFGDHADVEVASVKSIEGQSLTLGNVPHPANSTLTIAPSTRASVNVFGISFGAADTSGFTAPFAWSA